MRKRNVPAVLPHWEQSLYWTTETVTIVYMLYSLYHASQDARQKNQPIQIEDGWSFVGRPMDTADYEWQFWPTFFWVLLPWLCGHVCLSFTLTVCNVPSRLKAVFFVQYGLLAISFLLGVRTVMFLCIQSIVLHFVSKLGSVKMVWLTTLFFLTLMNFFEGVILDKIHSPSSVDEFGDWSYVSVFVWANLCQRATALALESVWAQHAKPKSVAHSDKDGIDGNKLASSTTSEHLHFAIPDTLVQIPDMIDMLLYSFYFPLFFTGPLITYNNFHSQFRDPQPCTRERMYNITAKLLRVVFWTVFNFAILHFIYPHAINHDTSTLAQQSRWTMAAIGYMLGQFFMTKYLVMFGLPAQVARLDGFEPPTVPACISYIYCYSDMWKCFDRGLYSFLKRYIFIPCGGSRAGLRYQLLGSVLCFVFIFYWHGAEHYLFLWCVLNFIEISLEQIGGWLETTSFVKRYVYDKLSASGVRRLRAIMSVPIFLLSVFAIFYFFGGTGSGVIFVRKLLIDIPWTSFVVFLMLVYCAVQNAMEIERLGLAKLKAS